MTCFGEMCLQEIGTVGVCWQSHLVHTQRMCWPGRTGDVHAEETFVRFLVIAPHTSLSHYLPKYQITRNRRIVSE